MQIQLFNSSKNAGVQLDEATRYMAVTSVCSITNGYVSIAQINRKSFRLLKARLLYYKAIWTFINTMFILISFKKQLIYVKFSRCNRNVSVIKAPQSSPGINNCFPFIVYRQAQRFVLKFDVLVSHQQFVPQFYQSLYFFVFTCRFTWMRKIWVKYEFFS